MRLIALLSIVAVSACGSDDKGGGTDGGDRGDPCVDSSGCNAPLVCDSTLTCQDAAECSGNGDCIFGSLCGTEGTCVGNVPGGPCDTDDNCVGAELCDNGTCVAPGTNGCVPPDMLIVLDRTGSMAQAPDGDLPNNDAAGILESKWNIAVTSIEAVTLTLQDGIRFGLALFPRDADDYGGAGDCSNLGTWLDNYPPNASDNTICEQSDLPVSPAINAAAQIDAALTVETTGLCRQTPIGSGLDAARLELASIASNVRGQYVLLITDGADNCDGRQGYDTDSLATAKALSANDVNTYVVGFDGSGNGIDEDQLNDLACAGGTAPNFMDNCVSDGNGGFEAGNNLVDDRLFLLAENAAGLQQALESIGGEICCGECGGPVE